MNDFQAGFAREVINPKDGTEMSGYMFPRYSEGILDDLELNTVALTDGHKTVILMAYDSILLQTPAAESIRKAVAEACKLPVISVFVSATHSHTSPTTEAGKVGTDEYLRMLTEKSVASAKAAVSDMKPARMGFRESKAENIAFIRRFRMKDGSARTNPGTGNPDIDHPLGEVDERLNVIRFDRENGDTILLMNFGNHPDTIGGSKISADWPGHLRRTLEKTLDGVKCIFFNGAEGDVNHINVNAKDGDMNGLQRDFDDVDRGYEHSRHMGRTMAGAVLSVYDKVHYRDVSSIDIREKDVLVPANLPEPSELPLAEKYYNAHLQGHDEQIPFTGMELTTAIADARRKVQLKDGPEAFPIKLTFLRIGSLMFVGFQGEPFTGIGRAVKETGLYEMVLPVCICNGWIGYFPMMDSYREGGYEACSSKFKAGTAELLIAEAKKMMKEMSENG